MDTKQILIVGDSFFSPNNSAESWQHMLSAHARIENVACNGVGQYKILKQLTQKNTSDYDFVIVGVTSPNRIHTENNPWHSHSPTHKHADLMYTDIKHKEDSKEKDNILWYFENVFDLEYYRLVHKLLVNEIENRLTNVPYQMYTFFDMQIPGVINLYDIWKNYPGNVNHLNAQGHKKMYSQILDKLPLVFQ
jgi:hypothetical protein